MIVWGKYLLADAEKEGNCVLTNSGIYIRNGYIDEIAPFEDLISKYPRDEIVGNGKQLLMPGLIDAHSHGRGLSPLRGGIGYDHVEPWLHKVKALPYPGPYWNALYSAVKHIRSGFTAMHYLHIPRYPLTTMVEDMKEALKGLQATGLRLAVSVPVSDQNALTYDDETFIPSLPSEVRHRVDRLTAHSPKAIGSDYARVFSEFHREHNSEMCRICLLYTSPSPRDQRGSRMPSSA